MNLGGALLESKGKKGDSRERKKKFLGAPSQAPGGLERLEQKLADRVAITRLLGRKSLLLVETQSSLFFLILLSEPRFA
jgi:hypothetical protein